ncbi:MAG: phosphoglucosamine mutase [bacterium]
MGKERLRSLKISISGIRGIVGEALTPELLANFAMAFGTYMNGGSIVVGSDTRVSGEMVRYAVLSGLIATGCEVIDIGICPVPTIQIMVEELQADGGVAITASHNPKEWNALKFIGNEGTFLNACQGEELLNIYHQGGFIKAPYTEYKGVIAHPSAAEIHINKILALDYIRPEIIKGRKFTVALDTCNGAGATITPQLLERLGCEVVSIHDQPNGLFPHDPEPIPENLGDLCELVRSSGADAGFAQDADADRLAVVSERGEAIGEDYTLALAAKFILEKKGRGPVVANLSTSRVVEDVARSLGEKIVYAKIGEINVVEAMKRTEATIGGEGNGGVILPDVHYGRDSLVGIALILQLLAESQKSISQIAASLPRYHIVKRKVDCPSSKIFPILKEIREKYAKERLNLIDGVRIDREDSWIHIRPSNTEPVMRIVAEAKTEEEASRLCDNITEDMNEILSPQ